MPIVLAKQGRRFHAKVAHDIASSDGYCATKNLYYQGVKLHICAMRQKGNLPVPLFAQVTNAHDADIRVYEKILEILPYGVKIFADKAYQTQSKPIKMQEDNKILLTPVKKKKGQKSRLLCIWHDTIADGCGKPYQNARVECINGILKHEFCLIRNFENNHVLRGAVAEAIYIYNTQRLHTSLGYLTPHIVHCNDNITLNHQQKLSTLFRT